MANNAGKPFIKKFSHDGTFYIYDVKTNQIVEVEKPVYDIIDDYEPDNVDFIETKYKEFYEISELKSSYDKIKNAVEEHGLFSNFRPQKVALGIREPGDVKKLHEHGLKQLLLEITRSCNLCCSYCHASGKYSDTAALPSEMSNETCRKTIDFFCANSQKSEAPFISFYGGEPLLRFDLIKESVEYVRKTYGKEKYSFNITSNGTLLNKDIIDFFIQHDIRLMVSLDGPEKINNRYRLYKAGGSSSDMFQTIMKNLAFIKKYNKDYYTRNISISSVLTPPFDDIDEILEFFSSHEIFNEIRTGNGIRSSLVDTSETTFIEDFDLQESMKGLRYVYDKFLERLKEAILDNKMHRITIEKTFMHSILNNLAKRQIKHLYDFMHPLGACHLGLRRVFVNTAGDFYICERCGNNYKIGCIGPGFDYDQIAGYYRKFEEVMEDCRDCWALIHCDRCWAQLGNLDKFIGKQKELFCNSKKYIIENAFKVYTELLKKNPDSLKVFSEVV
ncbi:MAG: radical SAM protein [Acidobacteria bacterium]|jgi:uncharacterized protein|nr:radical SAM protein [Acidobacteriota bacterium]